MRWFLALSPLVLFVGGCSNMAKSDGADSSLMSQAETQQQLGSVDFKVSCQAQVQPVFDRGLALLHHMTYQESRTTFQKITQADPECAMGYWGEAMTYIHPLWSDPPDQSEFNSGVALVQQAQQRGQKSERENAYIAALEAYFSGDWSPDEAPRLARYADAWNEVHQRFPDDIEAAAFYALANLSTADPSDKSYKKQQESGSLGQHILTERADHPGGHHYAIHAYDYPPLSHHGLEIAHSYGTIAPDIPHALHMPTHIFTREGLWQESIDWNLKSAEAALKSSAGRPLSLHYLHALDYLVYAYLQRGEDQKAEGVMATMAAIDSPIQPHGASAYTLAAIPARLALERQQWQQAAALQPQIPSSYPWDKFPAMEAITHFARALGAARTGDSAQAQQALDRLAALKAKLPPSAAYWATQIEIQHQSALAWLQYQQGDQAQALAIMQQAAMLEASTEKHPITPGEVLSAHELYADMLLAMKRFDEALAQYKASLERNPNRLNSLYGAGYACESRGDSNMAKAYYQQLVAIAKNADTELERLAHAVAYLKNS